MVTYKISRNRRVLFGGLTLEQAADAANVDPTEIEWAIETAGRCDVLINDKEHTIRAEH